MGRGGLFRYDNSDHALLSGIRAARNLLDLENNGLVRESETGAHIYRFDNKISHHS